MNEISIDKSELLEIKYAKEKLSTDNIDINSDKSFNEYEIQEKYYILDINESGQYDLEYDGNILKVKSSSTIESFEDNSLSEYSGETGSASIQNNNSFAIDGDNYLSISAGSRANTITSLSGLGEYPNTGDTFEFWTYITNSGVRSHTNYARQEVGGSNNSGRDSKGYQVVISPSENYIALSLDGYFGGDRLSEKTVSVSANNWYRVRVEWTKNNYHNIDLYDESGTHLKSISTQDSTYNSGGIAFSADNNYNSSSAYWDGYLLK